MTYLGEIIALSTVFCWTISIQFFEVASRRIGAIPVNIFKLTFALILFSLLLFIRHGHIIPLQISTHAWFYLGLSGIVGFFFGDI